VWDLNNKQLSLAAVFGGWRFSFFARMSVQEKKEEE